MQLKKTFISIIILIIAITIAFDFGIHHGESKSSTEIARLNKALDTIYPTPQEEIFSVFGVVTAISNNELSIEITSPSQRLLPGDTPQMETRVVTINKDTKITQFEPFATLDLLDASEIDTDSVFSQPEPKTITLADLSIGDDVSVTAEENIKTKEQFVASEVVKSVF